MVLNKFNLSISVYFYHMFKSVYFKISKTETTIDPDKISEEDILATEKFRSYINANPWLS